MAGIHIAMWNSGGLQAATPSMAQKMEFPEANFSVAAFLETQHKDEDDFPDLSNEYRTHHHCIHAPTPPDNKNSGIIPLVNKQYDVLHSEIKMPGHILDVHLAHAVTKHTYNLMVYYAPQVKKISKPQMVNIVKNFSQVHDISPNNIIISDFNFGDADKDNGKGMNTRDIMMHSVWEGFLSEMVMVDPFHVHSPKQRIYSVVSNAGKIGVSGFMSTRKVSRMSLTISIL